MNKKRCYIIAEAGVNHNGSLILAKRLCDCAKEAGVDAVKFQTWKTELIITKETKKAAYQEELLNTEESQFEMLKKLELSYPQFEEVKKYCDSIGIQFLSTADEVDSMEFLIEMGLPIIKLGSGDIDNIPFLRYVSIKRLPVILSTGMSNIADVEVACDILKKGGVPQIALLHCTTNYPCPMDEVNLNAMLTLKEAFKCEIGYSDHTMGIEVPVAAVAVGATIIEKHFTLDKNLDGPDHKASLDPSELKAMVTAIRNIEQALGDGLKQPNQSEKEISTVVLKKIVAKESILEGEYLTESNLTVKRSSRGLSSKYWDLVIGTKACFNFIEDDPILLK